MRDLLLGVIVITLCVIGIARARIGLLGYLWFALMRPDIMAYSAAYGRPYSKMLAMATIVGTMQHVGEIWRWFRNPFVFLLLLLQIPIAISVWFAVNREMALPFYLPFLQMIAITLFIPLLITNLRYFRWLVLVMAVSSAAIGAKFGLWGVAHGGLRFYTAYGGFISDNNTMALAMAMTVPLCWYSRQLVKHTLAKHALLGLTLFVIATVVMCHSRSGALTLGVMFVILAARSKYKIGAALVLLLLSMPAVLLVQDSFVDRMKTINETESDGSIVGRLAMQKAAYRMWLDYPVIGVGFGGSNFAMLAEQYLGRPNVHVVHNNYMEMLVDSGVFAFLVFILLLFGAILWLGHSARRLRKHRPELEAYPRALEGALIAFAVGSVFTSRTYYDFIYILLMATAAWYEVNRELAQEVPSPVQSPRRMAAPIPATQHPVHVSRARNG